MWFFFLISHLARKPDKWHMFDIENTPFPKHLPLALALVVAGRCGYREKCAGVRALAATNAFTLLRHLSDHIYLMRVLKYDDSIVGHDCKRERVKNQERDRECV